jgi:hypothetical protein
MRVYVAGRFREYAKVRRMIDVLAEEGHVCTYDWTRTDEFDEHGEPRVDPGTGGAELPADAQQKYAINDLMGAMECDVLVLLAMDPLYGALIETGVALAMAKQVIVIGPVLRQSIFWALPNVVQVDSASDAIEFLRTEVAA